MEKNTYRLIKQVEGDKTWYHIEKKIGDNVWDKVTQTFASISPEEAKERLIQYITKTNEVVEEFQA